MSQRLSFAAALFAAAALASATTYTVTSAADSGAGSLRQAMTDANTNPGADTIQFNIVGSGVQTIVLASGLPTVTSPVTIDGYTQPGSSANTQPVGQGLNTVLRIEINGQAVLGPCFRLNAGDTTLKGLVINRCAESIELGSVVASNTRIEGNFLGTDPAGMQLYTNGFTNQVRDLGQTGTAVGGTAPAARNLISVCTSGLSFVGSGHTVQGNLFGLNTTGAARLTPGCGGSTSFALIVSGSNTLIGGTAAGAGNVFGEASNIISVGSTGNTVQGNLVGTNVAGDFTWEQNLNGIVVSGTNNLIGGTAAGAGNVVAGAHFGNGIDVQGTGHVVQGNWVGIDKTETIDLGNSRAGIVVGGNGITIGGIGAGEANIIGFNGGLFGNSGGVVVASSGQASIRGNRIYANKLTAPQAGLGIDLHTAIQDGGISINDDGDADGGGNGQQNFPIVTSASGTLVQGFLNSTPSSTFDLDFYGNPACDIRPNDYLTAPTYLGAGEVTTDGSGNATFSITLPVAIPAGGRVTATATSAQGATSEFSPRTVFSMDPKYGQPSGAGIPSTITGMMFESGATVTVGGVPAINVTFNGPTSITATMPPLPPGTANDVVVTNPSGLTGTLENGWVTYFLDTPQFTTSVANLVRNGVTAGIGGGNYGESMSITREQMAVFLMKAKHGLCYVPPPCAGIFPDVQCPSQFANWIEALAAEGITGGCGGGNYCPGNPVTRQQMAVFLLKARHGSQYVPPTCTGTFFDVLCPSQYANWIEQMSTEGITFGCGSGNYCPLNNNTRGQMAAFIELTFGLF
jgi:hypothetical protein